jgi:hypothetical protein
MMREVAWVGLVALGCTGCESTRTDVILRSPSQALVAADELRAGRERVTVPRAGQDSIEVDAGWLFQYGHRDGPVGGPWTLEQLGVLCAPAPGPDCPATDDYAARLRATTDPQHGVDPLLWTTTATPDLKLVGAAAVAVGFWTGFVAAQVTCFSDWCGTGGKVAFVVTDTALVAGSLAMAYVMYEYAKHYR